MFTFSISAQPVEQALAAFQGALRDARPALQEIADDFREMIAAQFASEGRAGGTPWAPLAPSTLRRRGSASPILFDSGALFRSLHDAGAPGHIEQIEDQALVLGTNLPYALFHQTGTGWGLGQDQSSRSRRGRGLPMRPIVVLSPDRQDAWAEILQRGLEERTRVLEGPELGGPGP